MFVARRDDMTIYGCWTVRQFPGQEELPDDHPHIAAFLAPKPAIDQSDLDLVEKRLKALALCVAQVGGIAVPQMKVLFKQKFDSLP